MCCLLSFERRLRHSCKLIDDVSYMCLIGKHVSLPNHLLREIGYRLELSYSAHESVHAPRNSSFPTVSTMLSHIQARYWQTHSRSSSNRSGVLLQSCRCASETAVPAEDHTLSPRRVRSTRGTQGRNGGLRHRLETPIQILNGTSSVSALVGRKRPSISIQSPSKAHPMPIQNAVAWAVGEPR